MTRRWNSPLKKALIIENPDPSLDGLLRKLGIEPHRITETPDEAELVRLLTEGQHDFIYKRSRTQITEEVLRASNNLAAVMLCCIGDDSVDKEACARHGVMVMNDPVSNGRSVVELFVAEAISLSRRLYETSAQMNQHGWHKNNRDRYEVKGKKLGIIGLGKIGRQVAQIAEALDMCVAFFDSDEVATEIGTTLGWEAVPDINTLFASSDIVTVHVSAYDLHGKSNDNLLTYEHFQLMGQRPADSPRIFLNLARGNIYAAEALNQAVREGHIKRAMVDVFPEEPHAKDPDNWHNPYADTPNIFATPHIGAATKEAQPRIARYVARTTQLFLKSGEVRNCTFFPKAKITLNEPSHKYLLAVVHADKRGTKKAVSDAIFQAGANNLASVHVDFPNYGIAYDLSALDQPLNDAQIDFLIEEAVSITNDPTAIRAIRMIDNS